jgi:hypothetical protein
MIDDKADFQDVWNSLKQQMPGPTVIDEIPCASALAQGAHRESPVELPLTGKTLADSRGFRDSRLQPFDLDPFPRRLGQEVFAAQTLAAEPLGQ